MGSRSRFLPQAWTEWKRLLRELERREVTRSNPTSHHGNRIKEGRVVKKKLCWNDGCAVLHCWRKARRERCLREDVLLSVAGLEASPTRHSPEAITSSGWGGEKKYLQKTPPSAGKKKRREKVGEKRWGVCGRDRRRENASGPGVSKEPSQGHAAPETTGQTKASPTECYQVRKFLILFT